MINLKYKDDDSMFMMMVFVMILTNLSILIETFEAVRPPIFLTSKSMIQTPILQKHNINDI